ncbi:MAG: septal ring lytic transglycosylase RlpA family protein [Aeoliella sp.]
MALLIPDLTRAACAACCTMALAVAGCSSINSVAEKVFSLQVVGVDQDRSRPNAPQRLNHSPRSGKEKNRFSPRVARLGQHIPKGGGYKKLGRPYKIKGRTYVPQHDPDYNKVGIASWYGDLFHGRLTANGEVYDMNRLTAAHPTLPLPSLVMVTNLKNEKKLLIRVNDRGPYAHDRIIDLSRKSAEVLGMKRAGTERVRVTYVGPAPLGGDDSRERRYAELASKRSFLSRLLPW